jgi:hypothetical protein
MREPNNTAQSYLRFLIDIIAVDIDSDVSRKYLKRLDAYLDACL